MDYNVDILTETLFLTDGSANLGPINLQGPSGATGPEGKFGGDTQDYLFSATTSDASPGSGFFRFNNSAPSGVTEAYFSSTGQDNVELSQWLDSFDLYGTTNLRGRLKFTKKSRLQATNPTSGNC